jgi:hypothetical protein
MDILITETGNGGDIQIMGNDLAMASGWGNMPYLGMFGGNEESTGKRIPSEQAFDFWGNNLLMQEDFSIQFNSKTEKKLAGIALNSAGRIQIEQIVKQDLEFMKSFSDVAVSVEIIDTDHVKIFIRIRQPDNLGEQYKAFVFIYDAKAESISGDFVFDDFDDDFNV